VRVTALATMLIITEERLIEYTEKHAQATSALLRWGALVKAAKWRSLADTRLTFAHADPVDRCTVFNVKGNEYRLITRIDYALQTITLKHFLTHAEYDREKWKQDC
jgi:mRNA interferase HigB